MVAGFAAFLGKYLEQQFNLTTSSANQLLGRLMLGEAGLSFWFNSGLIHVGESIKSQLLVSPPPWPGFASSRFLSSQTAVQTC